MDEELVVFILRPAALCICVGDSNTGITYGAESEDPETQSYRSISVIRGVKSSQSTTLEKRELKSGPARNHGGSIGTDLTTTISVMASSHTHLSISGE